MQSSINIVALGVYRHVAATMSSTFDGTPFHMAAILDLTSSPQPFNYNPHNLGVVLHTLEPRPQVFITGAAITESMTNESIKVWDEYAKALGVKNTLVINLQGQPPRDGDWKAEIMRRLEARYIITGRKETDEL